MENQGRKLKELMLYVADKSTSDPTFGATKLNKILFFSDFLAYVDLGHSITGAEYQKLEHGPAPRQLLPVQNELLDERAAVVTPIAFHVGTQRRLTALRPADLSLFTAGEISLVDEILQQLWGRTAAEVSDLSHEWSLGWQVVRMGETIPYATALVVPPVDRLTDQQEATARRVAAAHGLLATAEG